MIELRMKLNGIPSHPLSNSNALVAFLDIITEQFSFCSDPNLSRKLVSKNRDIQTRLFSLSIIRIARKTRIEMKQLMLN